MSAELIVTAGFDPYYGETVVELRSGNQPGDRRAIRMTWKPNTPGREWAWDLWELKTYGWESNPFHLIGPPPPIIHDEETARAYVVSGQIPSTYCGLPHCRLNGHT